MCALSRVQLEHILARARQDCSLASLVEDVDAVSQYRSIRDRFNTPTWSYRCLMNEIDAERTASAIDYSAEQTYPFDLVDVAQLVPVKCITINETNVGNFKDTMDWLYNAIIYSQSLEIIQFTRNTNTEPFIACLHETLKARALNLHSPLLVHLYPNFSDNASYYLERLIDEGLLRGISFSSDDQVVGSMCTRLLDTIFKSRELELIGLQVSVLNREQFRFLMTDTTAMSNVKRRHVSLSGVYTSTLDVILPYLFQSTSLRSLRLDESMLRRDMPILVEQLKLNGKSLTYLSLWDCWLESSDTDMLLQILTTHTSVSLLDIGNNNATSGALARYAQTATSISSLRLSGLRLDRGWTEELILALGSCRSLTELNVAASSLDDCALYAIYKAMIEPCKSKERIRCDFRFNDMEVGTVQRLLSYAAGILSRQPSINDSCRIIELHLCVKCKREDMDELRRMCEDLRKYITTINCYYSLL